MSFSKRTREGFRNFSRRFDKDKPPASSIEAVANIPNAQPNGVHRGGAPSSSAATGSTRAPTTSTNPTTVSGGTSTSAYHLRAPKLHRKHSTVHASTPEFTLPDLPWLCGTWHVTHSTLPMWKDKRNVRITYTRLSNDKIHDEVTYQNLRERAVRKIHGVDTPKRDGRYVWRGKGLLKVATSTWEILGWGGGGPGGQEEWVVTYFNRTMFTPAGIDIYSRNAAGLSPATIQKLMRSLGSAEGQLRSNKGEVSKAEGNFAKLVSEVYEVKRDGARDADEILMESAERLRG